MPSPSASLVSIGPRFRFRCGFGPLDRLETSTDNHPVAIAVLGPLILDSGVSLSPRAGSVLGAVAVKGGATVSPDSLADALWDEPPRSWPKQVQICIWSIRKELGPDVVETVPGGYRLALGAEDIDVVAFDELLDRAQGLAELGEMDRVASTITRALGLWRGRPVDEVDRRAARRHYAAG